MADTNRTEFCDDIAVMQRALSIAERGIGLVEPNPAVGAVIVDQNRRLIAEGFHQQFGQPHAEVNAINNAGESTKGAHLFVTLEPCSHHGKTPPCADAVVAAGFSRVVIGCQDPAVHVAGKGIERLRQAGVEVEVGVCQSQAEDLIAPFRKLMLQKLPWVHAKWAMTLDGRIASRTGHSKWISNQQSRAEVHLLRGRMDAIITAAGTVRADDPMLTARPPGFRTALRVVVDSDGQSLKADSQLVKTASEIPVLVSVVKELADAEHLQRLQKHGVQIHFASGDSRTARLLSLLHELGQRQCTNVLIEAGGGLLGACFDGRLVDEAHVFVAPKFVGGVDAMSPVGGLGQSEIPSIESLRNQQVLQFEGDVLIRGRINHIKEP